MVVGRLAPQPHHLCFAESIADDVRRHLDRLGRMRGLTIVRLSSTGGYSVSVRPAADIRPTLLDGFGLSPIDAMDVIDGLGHYDPSHEAAVLVVESNPIDGVLRSFLVLEWPA